MNGLRGMDPHQLRSHLVMSALEGMGATFIQNKGVSPELWVATVGTYRARGESPLAAGCALLRRILKDAEED